MTENPLSPLVDRAAGRHCLTLLACAALLQGCASTQGVINDQVLRSPGGMFAATLKTLVDPNGLTSTGETLLTASVRQGDASKVESLLQAGADPNAAGQGAAPLYWALTDSRRAMIDRLVAAGAIFDHIGALQQRELVCGAAKTGNALVLSLLTPSAVGGYIHDACAPDALNPIYRVIARGGDTAPWIALGADPSRPMGPGNPTPLMHAIEHDAEQVQRLLAAGVDLSAARGSPVLRALQLGKPSVADLLVARGADPGAISTADWTALGCRWLDKGAPWIDPGQFDRYIVSRLGARFSCDGEAALARAVANGDMSKAQLLLAKGADGGARDARGRHLLVVAHAAGGADAVKRLRAAGVRADTVTRMDIQGTSIGDDPQAIALLAQFGLSPAVASAAREQAAVRQVAAQAAAACRDASWRHDRSALAQPFLVANWKPLQQHRQDPAAVAELLRQERRCLDSRLPEVQAAPGYPYRRGVDGRPRLAEDGFGVAKIRAIQALTHLAPAARSEQQPQEAKRLMLASYEELKSLAQRFNAGLETYAMVQRAERDRLHAQAERNAWIRAIGGVVGAAIVGNQTGSAAAIQDFAGRWSTYTAQASAQELESIAAINVETPEFIGPSAWEDDGVRLFVPRFGKWWNSGSLGAHRQFDHTVKIFRLRARYPGGRVGSCTAALIGAKELLTAQHCIRQSTREGGAWAQSILVDYEYMENVSRGEGEAIGFGYTRYVGTWNVRTGFGHSDNDSRYDWALLKLVEPDADKVPHALRWGLGWASPGLAQTMAQKGERVSVAGYSSHLSGGQFLTMDWGCRVAGVYVGRGLLEPGCPAWKGDSGSPVVAAEGPEKGAVMGVMSFVVTGSSSAAQQLQAIRARRGGRSFSVSVDEIRRQIETGAVERFQLQSTR